MNKNTFIIVSLILAFGIIGAAFIVSRSNNNVKEISATESVVIKDGIQYITITAQGGYAPRITDAKANIQTKLIVKTQNTYDCSSALVIRSVNYQKMLSATGEEVIDLGTPTEGSIRGTCSMGMYGFVINFK